jgi:hypothetical protein
MPSQRPRLSVHDPHEQCSRSAREVAREARAVPAPWSNLECKFCDSSRIVHDPKRLSVPASLSRIFRANGSEVVNGLWPVSRPIWTSLRWNVSRSAPLTASLVCRVLRRRRGAQLRIRSLPQSGNARASAHDTRAGTLGRHRTAVLALSPAGGRPRRVCTPNGPPPALGRRTAPWAALPVIGVSRLPA